MSAPQLLRIWLAVVAFAIAIQLGGLPLLDSDEGRNAAVAREMAETNDYVMPRLNGLPYLDKPVVFFAAAAALMEVLGPTELAARLPPYLFTLATAALVFFFARRLWGGDVPWVAAIVFLATPMTVAFARTVIFDSALMFFTTLSLVAFYFAIDDRDSRWSVVAWASMALAMITKGPVTFVLVLFVILPYAWKRQSMRRLFPIAGIVAFAAIVGPWVWGVSQVVPEFLRYVLITETAERMATPALERTGPPWFFIPFLVGGGAPWAIVALSSWREIRRSEDESRTTLFLILWIVVPFIFFSLSQSKQPQYILPLMPAVALLVAPVWNEARTRAAAVFIMVFGGLLLAAPLFLHRTRLRPEIEDIADGVAVTMGVVFVLGSLMALFARRRELVLIALTIPPIALPLLTSPVMHAIAERRSTKSLVAALEPYVGPNTHIIGVEAFTGSMTFYLGRRMTVITDDATELTSNYLVRRDDYFRHHPASPLKPLPFFERSLADCCTPRIYILSRKDEQRQARLESIGWRAVARGAHHVAYVKR